MIAICIHCLLFFFHLTLAVAPTGWRARSRYCCRKYFTFFFIAIYIFHAFISVFSLVPCARSRAKPKWNKENGKIEISGDAIRSCALVDLCTNKQTKKNRFSLSLSLLAPDEELLLLTPNSKALQIDRKNHQHYEYYNFGHKIRLRCRRWWRRRRNIHSFHYIYFINTYAKHSTM